MTPSSQDFSAALLERFLRYVRLCTTSDPQAADRGVMPSTGGQRDFAELLRGELAALGLEDARVTEHGYVCARLPPSPGLEGAPCVCFLAHMDTSEAAPGKDVHPLVTERYSGAAIPLRDGVVLDPAGDEALAKAAGETIVHGDGSTLLGADDKAGIAEIITALEALRDRPEAAHGPVEVIFSPDEETGHGMDRVPLDWIRAKAAYTLDGGGAPELEAECFNAYKSDVLFTGVAMHTGTARPGMVNAVNLAADLVSLLPRHESPETTDGRQGFFAPISVSGSIERAAVQVFVRDFDSKAMEERLKTVETLSEAVRRKYRGSTVSVTHTRQYVNMKGGIQKSPPVTALLVEAVRNAGAEPVFKPIRGGTDGSRLTEMGIPTPNIFTGGHNFHSRREWASLDQMILATRTVIELIILWGKQ